jgi:hypothetical protein
MKTAKIEIKKIDYGYGLSINGITAGPAMTYAQAKKEAEAMKSPNYARKAWAKEMEVNY